MGNSTSGSAVAQRVEQAGKTGVCSLKDQKLTEVGSARSSHTHTSTHIHTHIHTHTNTHTHTHSPHTYPLVSCSQAQSGRVWLRKTPPTPPKPPHHLPVPRSATDSERVAEDSGPLHQQAAPPPHCHWRLLLPAISQPLPQQAGSVNLG